MTKEKRIALVIGNAAYKNTRPLLNTKNDARAIAAALKRLGFSVSEHANLGHGAMGTVFARFVEKAHGADIAIIYFSGHGVEIKGENYLLPVDVTPESPESMEWNSTPLNRLLRSIEDTRRLFLVILDACRDNPFAEALRGLGATRSAGTVSRGLASVDSELRGNNLVAYAAKHGSVAWDGDEGGNSPFARALLDHLETPVEVRLLFGRIRDQVRQSTDGRQNPHLYGSLGGEEIYLREPEEAEPSAEPQAPESVTDDDAGATTTGEHRQEGKEAEKPKDEKQTVLEEMAAFLKRGWLAFIRTAFLIWIALPLSLFAVGGVTYYLTIIYPDDTEWAQAQQAGTLASYQIYLDAYPEGRHAEEALAEIEALDSGRVENIISTKIDPLIEKLEGDQRHEARKEIAEVLGKHKEYQSALANHLTSLLGTRDEIYRRSLGIVEALSKVEGGWQASPAAIEKLEAQRNGSFGTNSTFLRSLDAAFGNAIRPQVVHGENPQPVSLIDRYKYITQGLHSETAEIKQIYSKLGLYSGTIDDLPDEAFGDATEQFQERFGLTVDRRVGPQTYARIKEEARKLSAEGTTALKQTPKASDKMGREFQDCPACPKMMVVAAGSFLMGSIGEISYPNERPQHKVTFETPFAIGKYEVTFSEWNACVDDSDCDKDVDPGNKRNNLPVADVSWKDAVDFTKWLARNTGKTYRLPSEAEWEYAARAGSNKDYPWGDEIGIGKANCNLCGGEWGDGKRTSPVGTFPANAFGLHDTHGNVWEWVQDPWHDHYFGARTDGSVWIQGGNTARRVIRGGSFDYNVDQLRMRTAARLAYGVNYRRDNLGFRVARDLAPDEFSTAK